VTDKEPTIDPQSPSGEEADERLLGELRLAASVFDPVPSAVIEAAKAAWTWRNIDTELAELTYDSWSDDKALAGVRGAATMERTSRLLSFEAKDAAVGLELELATEGEEWSLVGQIVPPQPGVVEVHHRRGSELVEADVVGRFAVTSIAPGLFRLSVRPSSQSGQVATAWIQV
jgi:hypothetical protein